MRLRLMSRTSTMAGLGASLLVAALWPAIATGGSTATSRVLRLNISDTSVEFIDPALNYDFLGWRLETMTCARLLSYPDKSGAAGARLVPEVARSMPRVSDNGLTYTFRIRPGFRFSDGSAVTARQLQARDRARPEPEDAVAGRVVRGRHRRGGRRARRQGDDALGCQGAAATGSPITLTRPAPDFLSRIAMLVLLRGTREPPHRLERGQGDSGRGPLLLRGVQAQGLDPPARRNPYYRGTRPQRWDEVKVTQNVNVQTSYLQVRRGDIDLDIWRGSRPRRTPS